MTYWKLNACASECSPHCHDPRDMTAANSFVTDVTLHSLDIVERLLIQLNQPNSEGLKTREEMLIEKITEIVKQKIDDSFRGPQGPQGPQGDPGVRGFDGIVGNFVTAIDFSLVRGAMVGTNSKGKEIFSTLVP